MRRRPPVVSIGNLAMGGRGKTPVTALVARLLVAAGERPAILSRGYGRRERPDAVVLVSDGTHVLADLDRSGDEPLMLARQVPGAAVLVHEIRALAAAAAEHLVNATVHVLDDGFQHRSLRKDLELVIVNGADLSARRLPFGPLRSPVSALRRADAVLLDGDEASLRENAASHASSRANIFALRRTIRTPVPLEPDRPFPPGRPLVVALAGIARPARFTEALRGAGWQVAGTMEFVDHHRYSAKDVARIAERARTAGAGAVLTTEKDAIRLLPLRPLPVPVAAVPLEVTVEPADRFRDWLVARLAEVRA
jgi:tetraacyldisaccharide 4'-kinase